MTDHTGPVQERDLEDVPSPQWIIDTASELDPEPADVDRVARSVIAKARKLSRPATTLHTDNAQIMVTDRVVAATVAVRARRQMRRHVVRMNVSSADGAVSGVRMQMVARYGDSLVADADRVRDIVREVIGETLHQRFDSGRIDVEWVDMHVTQTSKQTAS